MANIKDVAKQTGVSVAVVSRYLNGDATLRIKIETRDRLEKTIKELNYKPSPVARALRSNTMQNIAVLVSDLTNPFFAEVFMGAQEAAHERGYTLTLYNTYDKAEKEKQFIDMVTRGLSDGVILTSAHVEDSVIKEIERCGLKYIMVVRNSKDYKGLYITSDDKKGVRLAVEHLYENGHRRIAHISGPLYASSGITKLEAFRETMMALHLECPPGYVTEATYREESGMEAMKVILSLNKRPTAVMAGNDLIAIGAISAIYEAGLKVPDDISVVGFDDIRVSRYINPAITTVSYNKTFLGYSAARLLINFIENGRMYEEILPVDVFLVKRGSVKRIDIAGEG